MSRILHRTSGASLPVAAFGQGIEIVERLGAAVDAATA